MTGISNSLVGSPLSTEPLTPLVATRRLRIGLNLLYAHPRLGGAWNYIEGVMQALGRFGSENDYVAYVHDASRPLVPDLPNFHIRSIRASGQRRISRVLAEQIVVPWLAQRNHLDLLHWFGSVNGVMPSRVASLVTIYDLKPFDEGIVRGYALRDLYMRSLTPHTARTATRLLPMSQTTASSLEKWFAVGEKRMQVIPTPIDERFRPAALDRVAAFRASRNLPPSFWLYVSHYYPHKNHRRLFQAYAQLRRLRPDTWKLVLCGRTYGADEILNQWIREAGIQDHIVWLSNLPGDEMPILFSAATALVFPSEYEGGGIPVMEAMACGCPVAASEIPALLEATAGIAVLFNPLEVDDIARAMLKMATQPDLLVALGKQGLARVQSQRPANVASNLLAAYRTATQHHPGEALE